MQDLAASFFIIFFLISDGTVDEIYAMDTMDFVFLRFSSGYIYELLDIFGTFMIHSSISYQYLRLPFLAYVAVPGL